MRLIRDSVTCSQFQHLPEQSLVAETGAFVEAVCNGGVNDDRDKRENGLGSAKAGRHGWYEVRSYGYMEPYSRWDAGRKATWQKDVSKWRRGEKRRRREARRGGEERSRYLCV